MKTPLHNQRGIALLLTLVILVLLVVLIVEFDYGTKINLITAGNFRDDVRATFLAKAGVSAARAVLKEDAKDPNHSGYDGLDEDWAKDYPSYPVGEGFVSVKIMDEAGKIDINRLGDKIPLVRDDTKAILTRLFKHLEVEPTQVDSIVEAIKNWVDPNPDQNCAEDFYYQRQNPSYHCKKATMETLSELLLVKGVTPEIYRKIRPYLTTVSGKTGNGNGLININTADTQVLQSLDDNITADTAQCIQDQRPYKSLNDFYGCAKASDACQAASPCQRQIGFTSNYFTATSHGIVHDTEKIVTALIQKDAKQPKLLSWEIQ